MGETAPDRPQQRPTLITDLLTEGDAVYPDWENTNKLRQSFYVDGIVTVSRLFGAKALSFLKTDKPAGSEKTFAELAIREVLTKTDWPKQVNFEWTQGLSANQCLRVRSKSAVQFVKAVHTIVACEIAVTSLRKDLVGYSVYNHLKVIPAVFFIEGFTPEIAAKVTRIPNSAANLRPIAGIHGEQLLKDLATGKCVTRELAYLILEYINNRVLLPRGDTPIGPVSCRPGRGKYGKGGASPYEEVSIK